MLVIINKNNHNILVLIDAGSTNIQNSNIPQKKTIRDSIPITTKIDVKITNIILSGERLIYCSKPGIAHRRADKTRVTIIRNETLKSREKLFDSSQ
jgi:hypothetical protein